MARMIRDAGGRTARIGDMVGGLTAGPNPITITGQLGEIEHTTVRVKVATAYGPGQRLPAAGTWVPLPVHRLFLIAPRIPELHTVRPAKNQLISVRWSGDPDDWPLAQAFLGRDMVGALDTGDGWCLVMRGVKGRTAQFAMPGWYLLRPPGLSRHWACDPAQYAAAYDPALAELTA